MLCVSMLWLVNLFKECKIVICIIDLLIPKKYHISSHLVKNKQLNKATSTKLMRVEFWNKVRVPIYLFDKLKWKSSLLLCEIGVIFASYLCTRCSGLRVLSNKTFPRCGMIFPTFARRLGEVPPCVLSIKNILTDSCLDK